ncbi:MAG: NnrS family protein [Woeseia sp.]
MAQTPQKGAHWVPFAYGFRPFFLLAGCYAVIAMLAWLAIYSGGATPVGPIPAHLWHGHEMLFGFAGAAIAGFMLTAVPSWTGQRGFAGWPLVLLTVIWLAGRASFATAGQIPAAALLMGELLFMPALALMIAPALLRARNRNTPLLLVLLAFCILDAIFLFAVLRGDMLSATNALRSGIDLILVLITVIGGRIVPSFTSNALKQRGIRAPMRTSKLVDQLTIGSMIALLIAGFISPHQMATAAIAGIACLAQLIRISGWQSWRCLNDPLVLILHVGYLWLPVALALKSLHLGIDAAWAVHWVHAAGAGAAGTMILAVMTRAALGHTGRPLAAGKPITAAYILLTLAVLVRTFGPALLPIGYSAVVSIAAFLWSAAFLVFVLVYAPILTRPRVDGRSG